MNQGFTNFVIDTSIHIECQMTTGDTFKVTAAEKARFGTFQRGHLADANSLDGRVVCWVFSS
jgi:hypothetical protein